MAEQFSEAVNQFSADIYQQCVAGTSSNVILSPLSIQTALSLALMGAKGKTAEEMTSVMKYGAISREDVANHYEKLMEGVSKSSCVKLANKVFVQKQYKVKQEFHDIATKKFHSEAENVDFNQADSTSKHINKWVEAKTNDKIKDLIKPDMLDSMTRMILVNAIYFKGSWEHQFEKANTEKLPFWINETESVDVDMMYQKQKYKYGEFKELNARAIEMTYQDSDISMFIILPDERTGLAKLEAQLKNINIADLTKNMYKMDVQLTLPKFRVEFEVGLKEILGKMGMGTMFSSCADFSDLLESPEPLQVADVVHKAFIEVNEEGAEAAAATDFQGMLKRRRISKSFYADHSFIHMIQENQTIYFIGRFNEPKKELP